MNVTRPHPRSMRRISAAAAPLLAVVLAAATLCGCAASKEQITRFQEDHSEFRARLTKMDQRLNAMQADIDSIKALLSESMRQELRAMQADQSATSQDFERRLFTLTTRFEENDRLLTQLLKSLDEVNRSLHNPVVVDGARASEEERALYEQGQDEYLRGEYDLARMGYRQLLQSFPESPLADDALYWIGESYMASQQPDSAMATFNQVISTYPQSNRASATLLKLGILNMETGRKDTARQQFQTILSNFPDSPEAEQATLRLEEL